MYDKVNIIISSTSEGGIWAFSFPGAFTNYLGAVSYIDYTSESWGEYQLLSPIFHMRKSFSHEREARAVIVNPNDIDERNTNGILIYIAPSNDSKKYFHFS